jgi:prepilin-type N-terminal cleavage/methylation domain-containing protein/prepilin-type processing-associated H-X9-DG protein
MMQRWLSTQGYFTCYSAKQRFAAKHEREGNVFADRPAGPAGLNAGHAGLPIGKNTHGRGFTLIELLTVMLIITMLAALAVPTLLKARERARRTSCRVNLKQIGEACMRYAHDFGEFYPTVAGGGAPSLPLASLAMLFDEYIGSRDLFRCPSTSDQCYDLSPGDTLAPHGQPPTEADAKWRECSYAYDDQKDRMTDPNVPIAADALPAVGEETTTISIGMGGGGQKAGKNSANHRGDGENVLFFDGHVEWSNTCFCGVDGDNIYEAVDPASVGMTDSYIHQ